MNKKYNPERTVFHANIAYNQFKMEYPLLSKFAFNAIYEEYNCERTGNDFTFMKYLRRLRKSSKNTQFEYCFWEAVDKNDIFILKDYINTSYYDERVIDFRINCRQYTIRTDFDTKRGRVLAPGGALYGHKEFGTLSKNMVNKLVELANIVKNSGIAK